MEIKFTTSKSWVLKRWKLFLTPKTYGTDTIIVGGKLTRKAVTLSCLTTVEKPLKRATKFGMLTGIALMNSCSKITTFL